MKQKAAPAFDIVYGIHPIIECCRAGKRRLITLYTTKSASRAWDRIKPHLPKRLPTIQYVTREALTRLAGTTDHMGVVATVEPFVYATKPLSVATHKRIVLLDGVQDVRNLGAILRSAYCTNFDAVILCQKQGGLVTAAALKASAGLAEHMAIYLVPSIAQAVSELRGLGYHLYLTVADGGQNALTVSYAAPLCLVIGSEEVGISAPVRAQGTLVTLPQRDASSYNASVAAGIFLFLCAYGIQK